LSGLGDVYRELGEYDEALSLYAAAIDRYPNKSRLRCGWALTLATIGRLNDAVKEYKNANEMAEPSALADVGLAQAYIELGQIDKALAVSQRACRRYKDESMVVRQYAECLLAKGRNSEALKAYNRMKSEHPYDYASFKGVADTYRAMGQLDKAEKAYDIAIEHFTNEVPLYLRRASLYKDAGDLQRSLQAYGELRNKFPTNSPSKFGQANLFKELGYFDRALELYKEVTDERAAFNPNIAIAAIHVVNSNFERAIELLPISQPTTKYDWVAYHVKGMALLKSGNVDEAIRLFENGVNSVPFLDQMPYFTTALTLAKMKGHLYKDALNIVPDNLGSVNNVIRLHIYTKLNRIDLTREAYASLQDDCYENIIPLRDELGAQLGLNDDIPQKDSNWIFEQECNALTLSVTHQQAA